MLVVPWRYLYSWILKRRMFTERAMILGSGKLATEIQNEIIGKRDSGYHIVGIVSSNSHAQPDRLSDIPRFKMDAPLCELSESMNVDKIIVAMDERRGALPTEELLRCKMNGVEIVEGETLYEELAGKIFVEKLNPSWLIFSKGFRVSAASAFTKRVTGLIIATLGLLIALPFIVLILAFSGLPSLAPM